jgi:hypothetical protein
VKRFTAYFKDDREVRETDGSVSVMYYYRIPSLTGEDKEQYKADRGQYYVEDAEGVPTFSVKNRNLGMSVDLVRALSPNDKTGLHSWYAKRGYLQVYQSLCAQYPDIAKCDPVTLKEMAQQQCRVEKPVIVLETETPIDKM